MRIKRLFWQLFTSNFLIIFLALLAFTFVITLTIESILMHRVSDDLEARAQLLHEDITQRFASDRLDDLDALCDDLGRRSQTRITVILPDGRVIADSEHDPRSMDNHRSRPEVQGALGGRVSTSTRFSATLELSTMYAAIPLRRHGRVFGVLRTAVPVQTVETSIRSIQWQIALGGLGITFLAGLMSLLISRRITRPIEEMKDGARRFADGELGFRLPLPRTDELRDLARVMNTMAEQLQDRISVIVQQHSQQDAVLSSMIEGVLAFDTEERLININNSAAELLNIDPEKALGRSIQEAVRNVGLQHFVEHALSTDHAIEGYITLVDTKERFLQAHGSTLKDTSDTVIGVLVVLNDVTELRTLENVRKDFVANVSHELKTPITSIKGFVETLLDGAMHDKDDAARFLSIVSKQADRLNAIIEDLLSLSRIEQGSEREEITLVTGSVYDAMVSAVQSCSHDADAKSITLHLDGDEALRALMNPPLLEQALVNLIGNAIKYSEESKDVWVSAQLGDKDTVTIMVRDEGCGIEAEHLPRLFERFYRIDKARSRKMGGTGLGLAIVKHIAQAHRGFVEVQSTPGQGSVFTIVLRTTIDRDDDLEVA
ncbi:MAG: PAS domain-containing sensor histidine kinase [Ignavibacteria bacterium]|nr:MAG: PAS domain-containing sensor histidine kinase [Ignavibacteria bacterium]